MFQSYTNMYSIYLDIILDFLVVFTYLTVSFLFICLNRFFVWLFHLLNFYYCPGLKDGLKKYHLILYLIGFDWFVLSNKQTMPQTVPPRLQDYKLYKRVVCRKKAGEISSQVWFWYSVSTRYILNTSQYQQAINTSICAPMWLKLRWSTVCLRRERESREMERLHAGSRTWVIISLGSCALVFMDSKNNNNHKQDPGIFPHQKSASQDINVPDPRRRLLQRDVHNAYIISVLMKSTRWQTGV